MATDPVFATTPVIGFGQLATAVTTVDNPTSSGNAITNGITLVDAPANPVIVTAIEVQQAQATVAAGVVRFYLSSNGSTWRLFDEIIVGANTMGNTAAGLRWTRHYDGIDHGLGLLMIRPQLIIPAGSRLAAITTITQALNVYAHGVTA